MNRKVELRETKTLSRWHIHAYSVFSHRSRDRPHVDQEIRKVETTQALQNRQERNCPQVLHEAGWFDEQQSRKVLYQRIFVQVGSFMKFQIQKISSCIPLGTKFQRK